MFDLNLKDKVILITGGSDGLGFASAKLLSEQGAKVALCGRSDYLKEKANIIKEETKNDEGFSIEAGFVASVLENLGPRSPGPRNKAFSSTSHA